MTKAKRTKKVPVESVAETSEAAATPAKAELPLKRKILLTSVGALFLLAAFVAYCHFTAARYWFDPAKSVYELSTVSIAKPGTKKAEAYMAIAEDRQREIMKLSNTVVNNTSGSRITKLANQMLDADHAAMVQMDKAKKAGVNIKYLAKRLCDDLDTQIFALRLHYSDTATSPVQMWNNLEDVEARNAELDLSKPIKLLTSDIDKAMQW